MINLSTKQVYGFEIDPFRMDSQAKQSQMVVTPLLLRELWTRHLIHEQNQLDRAERLRSPLQAEFATQNFFGHEVDDRSILAA